ncbi:MAG: phosphoribosylanthranilate isomerase [Candidatus Eisenbacteria bacterium]
MQTAAGRTIVKVCGLTRLEDASHALACGADWLGFVVRAESPRVVSPEAAGAIVAALPGAVAVAVMVAPTPDEALAIARTVGAARVQLHRVHPADWPADFPLPCAFGVGVDATGAFAGDVPPPPHLVLLDTAKAGMDGGTGETFPWNAARVLASDRDVMVAGGLGPDNVARAVAELRPFGVDASSRLETSPGIKDPERVRRFVAAVRESDERRRQPS